MLTNLRSPEPDALHSVMTRYAASQRDDKIDLGVGVYRERDGTSPILDSVSKAARRLLERETTKSYLPLRGNDRFLNGMQSLLGQVAYADHIAKIQTVGGTSGIRLALELAALATPELTVHIGIPTWPNHVAIPSAMGLSTNVFRYYDKQEKALLPENLFYAIEEGKAGDVVILHGPCHNPTGMDLSASQYWDLLAAACAKGIIPLIDAAYYGLGNPIEDDLELLSRTLTCCPSAFVVLSCSKAFGLYRERTGILLASAPSAPTASILQAHLESIARKLYSMAPAHGASLVAEILHSDELRKLWVSELDQMRERVGKARIELQEHANGLSVLDGILDQKGLFSLLPLDSERIDRLEREHAIFLPSSGRINIAGLKDGDAKRLCSALSEVSAHL